MISARLELHGAIAHGDSRGRWLLPYAIPKFSHARCTPGMVVEVAGVRALRRGRDGMFTIETP